MTLRFTCRECGHTWTQETRRNGQTARCPNCGLLALAQGEASPEDADLPGPSLTRVAASIPTWGTSLMVHLALVLCSLIFAWSVVRSPADPPPNAGATVVRKVNFDNNKPHGHDDPTLARSRRLVPEPACGLTFTGTPSPALIIACKGGVETLGIPGKGSFNSCGKDDMGRGGDGDGDNFFPVPPQGDVVYIVDRSGSMTDAIQVVKIHLKKAIGHLRGGQQFHVIFYSSGQPQEMLSRGLVRATDANKQAAFEFIDGIVPMGQTEPLEAFRRALSLRPQRIIFLTDGEFDAKVADTVRDLNRRVGARIDTICFIFSTSEPLLMKIAEENNGVYKYVAAEDVGL
ncbi:MAG: VWA domain-containing protein [Planctomycetes bacterium]|nr:VWA domain-containing protein [Planctomycetota bacterium]